MGEGELKGMRHVYKLIDLGVLRLTSRPGLTCSSA